MYIRLVSSVITEWCVCVGRNGAIVVRVTKARARASLVNCPEMTIKRSSPGPGYGRSETRSEVYRLWVPTGGRPRCNNISPRSLLFLFSDTLTLFLYTYRRYTLTRHRRTQVRTERRTWTRPSDPPSFPPITSLYDSSGQVNNATSIYIYISRVKCRCYNPTCAYCIRLHQRGSPRCPCEKIY